MAHGIIWWIIVGLIASATEGKQGCEDGMRNDDGSRHRPVH